MSSDFSLRVSREGENAVRAKDYKTVFNSDAPSVNPIYTGFVRAGTTPGTVLEQHNLGYRPLFLLWKKGRIVEGPPPETIGALAAQVNDLEIGGAEPGNTNVMFMMNDKKFWIAYQDRFMEDPQVDYYYAIFDVDLDTPLDGPLVEPEQREDSYARDSGFEFKVANKRSTSSKDLRDFSINSDAQPIMIHSVTPIIEETRIEHGLGYPPMFFVFKEYTTEMIVGGAFVDGESGYVPVGFAPNSAIYYAASVNDRYINFNAPITGSVVLFKDPIL